MSFSGQRNCGVDSFLQIGGSWASFPGSPPLHKFLDFITWFKVRGEGMLVLVTTRSVRGFTLRYHHGQLLTTHMGNPLALYGVPKLEGALVVPGNPRGAQNLSASVSQLTSDTPPAEHQYLGKRSAHTPFPLLMMQFQLNILLSSLRSWCPTFPDPQVPRTSGPASHFSQALLVSPVSAQDANLSVFIIFCKKSNCIKHFLTSVVFPRGWQGQVTWTGHCILSWSLLSPFSWSVTSCCFGPLAPTTFSLLLSVSIQVFHPPRQLLCHQESRVPSLPPRESFLVPLWNSLQSLLHIPCAAWEWGSLRPGNS